MKQQQQEGRKNNFLFFFICIFIFICLPASTKGQLAPARISEPWNSGAGCVNLSTIPDSVLLSCRSYLTYDMIYVDDLQAARESVWVQAQVLVVTTDACAYSAFRQICVTSFRPCYQATEPNTNYTFNIGGFPCRSLCDDVATNCLTTAQTLFGMSEPQAKVFLSCNPINNPIFYGFPTVDIFPPGNYTLQFNGQNITGNSSASANFTAGPYECYDANRYLVGKTPPLQCPEGLISHPSGTYCTLACPQPLMSNDEYDAIEILISVLSWCSVVSCFVTITLLLIFNRKRMQGPSLALIFAVGMESSAGCIGTIIGHEDVWCAGDGTANNFGDPWCTIQGIINVFFELAGISLWFIIIVDIFLSLVLGPLFKGGSYRSSLNLRREVNMFGKSIPLVFNPIAFSYVFFPMTLPLIPVIIALGAHQLGYDGSNLWCTIHSGSDVSIYTSSEGVQTYVEGTGNPWNMALMTGPSVIVVVVGVVLWVLIFLYVFIRTKGFSNRFIAVFRLFVEQWRLMLFVMIFALYYLIYLAFRINFEVVKSDKYDQFGTYVGCSNNKYYQCVSGNNPSSCGQTCEIPSYVNFPFWVVVVLGKWGKGMAMFPIFGISKAMITRIIKNSRTAITSNSSDSTAAGKGSLQRITGRIVTTLTEITRDDDDSYEGGGGGRGESKGSNMMDELEEVSGDSSSGSSEEGEGGREEEEEGESSSDD